MIPLALTVLATSLIAVPGIALAVEMYPPIICIGLFGCGLAPSNVVLESTLPTVAGILLQFAAGGAVIAIVIAGTQMTISYGDEGKVSNAQKGILFALGGLALALAAGPIVSFVTTENYGLGDPDFLFGPVGLLASALRIILTLFNVGFALVVMLAGLRMVLARGGADEFKKSGDMIKWAVVGAVVVNLARVVVQALLALNF